MDVMCELIYELLIPVDDRRVYWEQQRPSKTCEILIRQHPKVSRQIKYAVAINYFRYCVFSQRVGCYFFDNFGMCCSFKVFCYLVVYTNVYISYYINFQLKIGTKIIIFNFKIVNFILQVNFINKTVGRDFVKFLLVWINLALHFNINNNY